jgi:AP endonuclease 1
LETPAFDVTSGANKRNQFKPGEGWDIWRSEVGMLHKLAGSQTADTGDRVDFEAWTEQLREVVKRVTAAQAKADDAKKEKPKKRSQQNTGKKAAEEDAEEEDETCDEE